MPMKKISTPDVFRINVRDKLSLIIDDEKKGKNLEIGIYNYSLKEATSRKVVKKWDNPFFTEIYINHLRSIYINLSSNPTLLSNLKNNTIKCQTLAYMTHQEMKPEKWDEMIQQKIIRDKNKFETTIEASTDTFKCRKCGSRKTTYYSQQIRSCDEPTTIFVQCIDCGARWRC